MLDFTLLLSVNYKQGKRGEGWEGQRKVGPNTLVTLQAAVLAARAADVSESSPIPTGLQRRVSVPQISSAVSLTAQFQ